MGGCTADGSGNLYVVDVPSFSTPGAADCIWKVQLSNSSVTQFVNTDAGLGFWPRDVIFDAEHNRLLVIGARAPVYIQAINLADASVTNLVKFETDYSNGLARDQFGNTYAGGYQNGTIYRYDSNFTSPPEIVATGYNGPCNFDYNPRDHILAIPNYFGNYVDFLKVGRPTLIGMTYSDISGGDGDNILENRETIELVVTFNNPHFLPLTDFSVELYDVSGGLIITQGSSNIGSIPARSTMSNQETPILFEIPSGYGRHTDSFYLEITYTSDYGTEKDTLEFRKPINENLVLLVRDDIVSDNYEYYQEVLNLIDCSYDVWDAAYSLPPNRILNSFNTVIWFTGDHRAQMLDADEIAIIKDYLDSGGNLFLTGQGLASQLDTTDQDFLHNYLRAEYLNGRTRYCQFADTGNQVFDLTDRIRFIGTDGANNQTVFDCLIPANGGVAALRSCDQPEYGSVSYTGSYRLVFFSFGFEGIVSNMAGWTGRDGIFLEVIEFLGCADPVVYTCGDANGDQQPNVGDAVYIINYVFKGGQAPVPECQGDANDDGSCNVGDAVYLINYVFKGGAAPVDPCCQ